MESQLRELMQTLVGDPPHRVTAEAVRRRVIRRRIFTVIAATAAVAVVATVVPALTGAFSGPRPGEEGSPAGSYLTPLRDGQGSVFHDAAGWMVDVPPGWHAIGFHSSKDGATAAGVQVSNVSLPAPTIMPGFIIQASGEALPAHGVSLVIATDTDPKLCWRGVRHLPNGVASRCHPGYSSLPLSFRDLTFGSSSAGVPVTGFLWFKANGKTFAATAKFGSSAYSQRYTSTLSKVIASLSVSGSAAPRHALPPGVMSAAQACRKVIGRQSRALYFTGVERVHLVLTTYAKGEPVESQGDISSGMPPRTLVWVVEVHARAIHWDHSVPGVIPGVPTHHQAPARPDTDFSVVMNARTGLVSDSGESNAWPLPLQKAGTLVSLPPNC